VQAICSQALTMSGDSRGGSTCPLRGRYLTPLRHAQDRPGPLSCRRGGRRERNLGVSPSTPGNPDKSGLTNPQSSSPVRSPETARDQEPWVTGGRPVVLRRRKSSFFGARWSFPVWNSGNHKMYVVGHPCLAEQCLDISIHGHFSLAWYVPFVCKLYSGILV